MCVLIPMYNHGQENVMPLLPRGDTHFVISLYIIFGLTDNFRELPYGALISEVQSFATPWLTISIIDGQLTCGCYRPTPPNRSAATTRLPKSGKDSEGQTSGFSCFNASEFEFYVYQFRA